MSYDLYAFRLPSGTNPATVIDSLEREDTGAVSPETAQRNRTLAEALMRVDRSLQLIDDSREIELAGDYVEIVLWDEYAAISFPYGTDDSELAQKVGVYARTLEKLAGYITYDPQTEQVL